MKKVMSIVLATALLGVVAWSTNGFLAPLWAETPVESVQSSEQTHVFAVENMTCAACPFTVKKAIERVDGVASVSVDFDAKTATVSFDATLTTLADIADAPTQVGYPTTPQ